MEGLYVVGRKTDGQVKDVVVEHQRSCVRGEAKRNRGELTSRDERGSWNFATQSMQSKNESTEQTRR